MPLRQALLSQIISQHILLVLFRCPMSVQVGFWTWPLGKHDGMSFAPFPHGSLHAELRMRHCGSSTGAGPVLGEWRSKRRHDCLARCQPNHWRGKWQYSLLSMILFHCLTQACVCRGKTIDITRNYSGIHMMPVTNGKRNTWLFSSFSTDIMRTTVFFPFCLVVISPSGFL